VFPEKCFDLEKMENDIKGNDFTGKDPERMFDSVAESTTVSKDKLTGRKKETFRLPKLRRNDK